MAILSVRDLNKSFIHKNIIKDSTFYVEKGDRIGLVGDNGSGKTTLFKILADLEGYDSGDIYIRKGYEPALLKQHTKILSKNTIYEEVSSQFEHIYKLEQNIRDLELEISTFTADDTDENILNRYANLQEKYLEIDGPSVHSRILGVLKGLGFKDEDINKSIETLSGGQKSRVELAKLLLSGSKFLLLDEPTNHLDMEAINWLEGFLRESNSTYIIISHDRYFLDRTVDKIFLLDSTNLTTYTGNYTDFVAKREEELDILSRQYENQQAKIKKEKEIIERYLNTGKANILRQGLSRQKRLERKLEDIELLDPIQAQKDPNIKFSTNIKAGNDIFRVFDLSKSYGNHRVFSDISFNIFNGDRIGIIGQNGVGKTTILNILEGREQSDTGTVEIGSNVVIGYFDQEMASLDPTKTVIDDVWDSYPTLNHYEIRSYLAKMNFTGEEVLKEIHTLSGGEQSRVSLLKLMMSNANVLLMDEPTNHLDIVSKELLEKALESYNGTVVAISHDRYFLNHFANKIWDMSSDSITEYLGNYDYYREKKAELDNYNSTKEHITATERQKIQRQRREKIREEQKIREQYEDVMTELEMLENKLREMEEELYLPENISDHKKSTELISKTTELQDEIDLLYKEWIELASYLE